MELIFIIVIISIFAYLFNKYKSQQSSTETEVPKLKIEVTMPDPPLQPNDFENREEYYDAVYKGNLDLYDALYDFIKKEINNQFFLENERSILKSISSLPPELYLAFKNLVDRRDSIFEIEKKIDELPNYLLGNAINRLIALDILQKNITHDDKEDVLSLKTMNEIRAICKQYSLKTGGKKVVLIKRLIENVPNLKDTIDLNEYCRLNPEFKSTFNKAIYLQIMEMEKILLDGSEEDIRFGYMYPVVEFYHQNKFYKNWEKCIKYCRLDIDKYLDDFINEKKTDYEGNEYYSNKDEDGQFYLRVPTVDTLFDIYIKESKYDEAIDLCNEVEQLGYNMEREKEMAGNYLLEIKNQKID